MGNGGGVKKRRPVWLLVTRQYGMYYQVSAHTTKREAEEEWDYVASVFRCFEFIKVRQWNVLA